jgi:hypothetical protein
MDVKLFVDGLAPYAQSLAVSLFVFCVVALLLRTRLAKRLWASIEETLFSNWQLGLLRNDRHHALGRVRLDTPGTACAISPASRCSPA